MYKIYILLLIRICFSYRIYIFKCIYVYFYVGVTARTHLLRVYIHRGEMGVQTNREAYAASSHIYKEKRERRKARENEERERKRISEGLVAPEDFREGT